MEKTCFTHGVRIELRQNQQQKHLLLTTKPFRTGAERNGSSAAPLLSILLLFARVYVSRDVSCALPRSSAKKPQNKRRRNSPRFINRKRFTLTCSVRGASVARRRNGVRKRHTAATNKCSASSKVHRTDHFADR